MLYKKMNVKETEPTVGSFIKNCHVHRNFYLDDPSESFPVIIYYQEYEDKQRDLVKIEIGDISLDDWADADDLYEQVYEEISDKAVDFFCKHSHLNYDVNSLLEDMLTYIQVYLETNEIKILE